MSSQIYAKVFMKPSQLLDGEFFNQYIKTGKAYSAELSKRSNIVSGNIIMLSERRPDTNCTFTLIEGVLRIEVNKAMFERMGLQGVPIPSNGGKHVKTRYGKNGSYEAVCQKILMLTFI